MNSPNQRQGFLRRIFLLATLTVATIFSSAHADELFAVSGTGVPGYSGDSGDADAAQLNLPHSVVVDGVGNIYIADFDNNRVRRIAVNGTITTVAGTGVAGFSGDGGLATSAELNQPIHLAVDANNNIYVLDFGNRRIRKIDVATGIIDTLAGNGFNGFNGDGLAPTQTNFSIPWGIALDAAGDLYIADRGNHRIRKIDIATNLGSPVVTTVAGNGTTGDVAVDPSFGDGGQATAATLNSPHSLLFDGAGNMYIADTFNHRIRMVDTLGVITTVAGEVSPAAPGQLWPGFKNGLAAEARFRQPRRISLSAAGDLYIADANNNRIRKLDTLGMVSTVAGTGVADFNGDGQAPEISELNTPNDVFVAASGDVYIADTDNHRARVISADSANAPPTDITLDNDTALSSAGVDALVGTLSTDDVNGANVHVYSLVAGTGDTDNGLFAITGDQLTAIDATAMSGVYSVRIMTHDQVDASFVEAMVVNVQDDVSPVITLLGDDPQTFTAGLGTYIEAGATASDNVDGDLSGSINIDASGVVSGTPGDYTVSYDVTDAAGNVATLNRTVTVLADTTAPVITLLGDNPQNIMVGGTYVELGATAIDDVDGDISLNLAIDSSAVDTDTAGNYTVTYDVTDAAGNAATTVERTVSVVADTTAPVITLLGDDPQIITVGGAYTELGATAVDDIDGDISSDIVIDSSAVDTATAANYTVTYNVTDAAGNAATTVSRVVSVRSPPPPPPPPPPVSSGGGSTGVLSLLFLIGMLARRRFGRILRA